MWHLEIWKAQTGLGPPPKPGNEPLSQAGLRKPCPRSFVRVRGANRARCDHEPGEGARPGCDVNEATRSGSIQQHAPAIVLVTRALHQGRLWLRAIDRGKRNVILRTIADTLGVLELVKALTQDRGTY